MRSDTLTLPSSWQVSSLGKYVAQGSRSIIPNKSPKELFELYSVPSHGVGAPEILAGAEIQSNKQIVEPDTVLLCKINPRINRSWVVESHTKHLKIASTEWITFPPNDDFEPKYLAYYLKQDSVRDFLAANASGVGGSLMRVRPATIKDYPFSIAPKNDQKLIVAEIEKQFSRLDEAVAGLKRVKANLKRYKAAVLKAAVEGRLVETEAELARREGRSLPTPRPGVFFVYAIRCDDGSIYIGHTDDLARRWEEHLAGQGSDWTRQHKPIQIVHYEEYSSREEAADREKWLKTGYGRKWIKREIEAGRARQVGYETGEQMLKRILEERRRQWKGKGKYKEPATPDTTGLPELPEGWVWATIEQLNLAHRPCAYGVLQPGDDQPDGTLFIRVGDINDGQVDISSLKRISPEIARQYPRTKLSGGEFLITLVGAIGRTAVVPELLAGANVARAVGVVPLSQYVYAQWVEIWFRNPAKVAEMTSKSHEVARKTLNLEDVRVAYVAVPPLTEQTRIVAEVERRFSLVNEIEAQVNANLLRADRLRQSTLSAAFSARLHNNA